MRPDNLTSSIKAAAHHELTRHAESLVALSHRLHAHPELGFEEERACGWLASELGEPDTREARLVKSPRQLQVAHLPDWIPEAHTSADLGAFI